MDLKLACDDLLLIKAVFDEFNMPLILAKGVLLGVIREKRLLPWDHDLDLWTLRSVPYPEFTEAMKHLNALGFDYWEFFETPKGIRIHWTFDKDDIHFGIKMLCPSKDPRMLCETGIFWGRKKGTTITLFPERFLDPPAEVKFLGTTFLAPNPPKEYLEKCYGDWRTPVKDNSFLKFRSWEVFPANQCKKSPWPDIIRIDAPARIKYLKKTGKWKGENK